jgi:hypothetical protein
VDGNINNDPIFVDAGGGDFHLMAGSPCIDRGDNGTAAPANDYDNEPRIADGDHDSMDIVDMGADEYIDEGQDGISNQRETDVYGTDPGIPDSDNDGIADGDELLYWGTDWDADYDGDGDHNLVDPDADNDGHADGDELAAGTDSGVNRYCQV